MEDDPIDIDNEFILRLPVETSRVLKALIHAGVSLKDRLTLDIYKDMRHAVFQLDNWVYSGKIYDLPTITESLKTVDGKSFFKTADVSQILICKGEDFSSSDEDESAVSHKSSHQINKKYQWNHGLTPPLKNVRKHRFRKTLPKEYVELSEIEKEVKTLLRADNDAASVKWEIIYENDPQKTTSKDTGEIDIFGASISDLENEVSDSGLAEGNKTLKQIRKESSSSEEKLFANTPGQSSKCFTNDEPASSDSADTKSEDSNADGEELYNLLQEEIRDLDAKRAKLQRKIGSIENITLRHRMIEVLRNFEREIFHKNQILKKYMLN